jgi:hypothetical protein
MRYYRRPGIFPALFVGLLLLLIGTSVFTHLFFPFHHFGYYGWFPFFPWGGFFLLRTLIFIGIVIFIARRFFWGPRWSYGGPGWANYRNEDQADTYWSSRGRGQYREYRQGGASFEKSGNRNTEDYLELVSGFGTAERKPRSRNFQGGDVTTIMGQLIIDLRDADLTGTARLKVTQIQGTTTLITPMDWDVRPGEGTILTTYQDSTTNKAAVDPDKVLIIDGTCIKGGIEVRTS